MVQDYNAILLVIVLAVMIKSYHVNKILEPSYLGIFPWVQTGPKLLSKALLFKEFPIVGMVTHGTWIPPGL